MKKIIREGTSTYHGHCHECGCDFTYERADVHPNYVIGGRWVSCPSCGHAVHHHGAPARRPSPRWSAESTGGYIPDGLLPKGSCFAPKWGRA